VNDGATRAAARPPAHTVPRSLRIVAVVGLNVVGTVAILSYLLPGWPSALLVLTLLFVSFFIAYRWDLTKDPAFRQLWVGLSLLLGIYSVLSGWHNGLTDEPFVTPAFAQLWPNLYGSSVTLTYDQYGTTYTLTHVYNVYLPLLAFVEFPVISYKWTSLAAWAATVWGLGARHEAVFLWGSLWVALMAANGFNDFVPFLALTLAFVVWTGTPSKLFEVISLGLKQFANLVVVGVHLYRREWRAAALAVVVTAAILAPFAYLAPGGVVCHVLLIQPGDCEQGPGPALGTGFTHHLNYLLWPLFVIAVFVPAWVRDLRSAPPGGWRGWLGGIVRRYSRPRPPAP
jgi:hypothetical protein